jgi:hypothetical protein
VATRYDLRNGLTLCYRCHWRVTGAVNDKLIVVGARFFTVAGVRYINGSRTVRFTEAK